MENELKNDAPESEETEELQELDGREDEGSIDWKAEALKRQGINKRLQTKLKKLGEVEKTIKPEPEAKPQDKKEFDLGEKSYLLANGVKKTEFSLVFDEVKESGKSIEEVLESKYFQEKLEFKRTKDATPSGTKRTSGSAKDDVDYWIQQGKLPPKEENPELFRKVRKALEKRDENKTKFSPNPIV